MAVGQTSSRSFRDRAIRSPAQGPLPSEVMTFCALRLLDHHGALSAMDLAEELAPTMRLFGRAPAGPTPPLLHRMEDAGLVVASKERPPRYQITPAGRHEAERLAPSFRRTVSGRVARINARVAILFYEPIPH